MSTCKITRRFEIDYGHRLLRHEGKCRNLHGHRGVVEVRVSAPGLDDVGRVVDFSVLKAILGGWLDEHWDHAMIVQAGDPLIDFLVEDESKYSIVALPPTAENLAAQFLAYARALLPEPLRAESVRWYETPNCWADAVAP